VPQAARAGYVVALLAVIALAGVYMVRSRHPSAVVADDATVAAVDDLPAALATTAGARWLHGVRPHCNPIEVGAALRDTPPPSGKDGRAFAIACVALSGEIARARAMVTALPAPERAYAVWPTFEVVHALADSHDAADTAVADALRFVLEFWPENYLALYHVGIAEYLSGDSRARDHLTRFLALHPGGDRFTLAARAIYTDIVTPTHDCRVLAVDPEGTTIHGLGCP
jgi:hypothetical protein